MSRLRKLSCIVDGGSLTRWSAKFTNCASGVAWISIGLSGLVYLALLGFGQPARADAEQPKLVNLDKAANSHPHFDDADLVALRDYAQQAGAEQPKLASIQESGSHDPHFHDADIAALRDYAQLIGAVEPNSASLPRLRVAEADNAFDALRDLFRRGTQPDSTPKSAPRPPPSQPRPAAPRHDPPVINASFLGERTCLMCHANQAASFGKTLMGGSARRPIRANSIAKAVTVRARHTCRRWVARHVTAMAGSATGPEYQASSGRTRNILSRR